MFARRRAGRRGYALLEITVAVVLLLAAMNLTVKMLGWVAAERRGVDRRHWAIQSVANVMERVTAEPFDRVTVETARSIASRSGAATVLPGAEWSIAVDDDRDAPIPARRVSINLRWKERAVGWEAPVRVSSWVFDKGRAQ